MEIIHINWRYLTHGIYIHADNIYKVEISDSWNIYMKIIHINWR